MEKGRRTEQTYAASPGHAHPAPGPSAALSLEPGSCAPPLFHLPEAVPAAPPVALGCTLFGAIPFSGCLIASSTVLLTRTFMSTGIQILTFLLNL